MPSFLSVKKTFFPLQVFWDNIACYSIIKDRVFADNSIFFLFFSWNKKVQTVHRKIAGLVSGRSGKQAEKVKACTNGPIFSPRITPGAKGNTQEEALKCYINIYSLGELR